MRLTVERNCHSARGGPERRAIASTDADSHAIKSRPPTSSGHFVQIQILPFFATLLFLLSATAVQAAQFSVTDLGWSQATAINNSGQITGFGYFGTQTGAFRYTNGVTQGLVSLPGGVNSKSNRGNAINNSGQVVGNSDSAAGPPHAV